MSHSILLIQITLVALCGAGYIEPGPKYKCPNTIINDHICSCISSNDIGLNLVCENTNIATLSASLADISSSRAPIEQLHLRFCNISRLYGNLLYNLDIKILKLEDIPLKTIDDDAFLGVNETLQELFIRKSQLYNFPSNALKILGNLKKLVLDTHMISEIPENSFQNSLGRNLERLSITNGKVNQISNTVFSPLKKLKGLDLHGNEIEELKKNQFKTLKTIDFLDLSFNQIKKIDGSHINDLTNLGWFNMSNNLVEDLGRSIFARNSLLKVINMNHNRIRKIDVNTFRGMRLVRRLFLSNNNISDVGRSTFSTMTRIGTIDLSHNFLRKVDFQMFYELNYVEKIDVSYNNITEVEKSAFKDLYHVDILLAHNRITKIHTNAFVNCANITMLDFSHNQIETFSKNAFDELTFALHFQLAYNKLKDLAHVPLANMTGIKVLNASFNDIAQISRNTFPKLYELHTIDISHNALAHVSNAVMQPLLSLRFLNFSHNKMEEIKSETFGTLPTVLDLQLNYNQLRDISRGAFTKLNSLANLSLSHNNLSEMFELPISLSHLDLSYNLFETLPNTDVWPSMNALLTLNMANNQIGDTLTKGSFYPLLTLQSLDLSSNLISLVPWEALSDFTSLRTLKLRSNYLTQLNKGAFGNMPVVFNLDLSENQINNISVKAFDGLLQLINLDLSHNRIEHIPNGAFQGLVALQHLDLSFNTLESIDNKTNSLLEDCLTLKSVILSHNKISVLTKTSLPYNRYYKYKFEHIDLSHNLIPVVTFDFTFGTKDIKRLNLSYNGINEVRRYVLGNLTSLEELDMSHNEISNLHDPFVFKLPENLATLDLSHNLLSSFPQGELIRLKNVKKIDLQNNRFTKVPGELLLMLNRTALHFANNPLICDCDILPAFKWLNDQLETDPNWLNTQCLLPRQVPVHQLSLQEDINLKQCSSQQKESIQRVNIREIKKIHRNKDVLINWYINDRRIDIGDMELVLKQNSTKLTQRYEHYNTRYEIINLKQLNLAPGSRELDVCIISKDSQGETYPGETCATISSGKAGKNSLLLTLISLALILTL